MYITKSTILPIVEAYESQEIDRDTAVERLYDAMLTLTISDQDRIYFIDSLLDGISVKGKE